MCASWPPQPDSSSERSQTWTDAMNFQSRWKQQKCNVWLLWSIFLQIPGFMTVAALKTATCLARQPSILGYVRSTSVIRTQ